MSNPWLIFPIRDISGGSNLATSDFIQGQDELGLIVNWDLTKIGALKKIYGYSQRGESVGDTNEVLGLGNYYYTGGQKQLLCLNGAEDSDIYTYDPSDNTWAAQSQNLTAGSKMEFCTFLNGVFATNFTDATRYFNGTTWSTSTNVTSAPKARYVISYGEKLYLVNLDIGGTAHPSRVLPSSQPDDSYNITWDTSASGPYFDVSPLDGDELKGVGKNFNRLLFFKEKGLWRYDTNNLYQFPGAPGTTSHRSIQNVLDWTIYFHPSGIHGLKGNDVLNLSRAIKPIIDGVKSVNLDRICAWVVGDHYKIFLGDVINEEENINISNCIADLDVARMRWSIGSIAHIPRVFGTYRDDRADMVYDDTAIEYDYADKSYDSYLSAADYTYFGDDQGNVYELNNSDTFAGATINSYFNTPKYYPAGIQAKGELQALKIYTEKGRRCRFYYRVDGGPYRPVVRYEYRDGEIFYTFPSGIICNHIELRGVDNSVGDRPVIKGFDIFYTPSKDL